MKYLIWLKDYPDTHPASSVGDKWVDQGDGPLTAHQAERIAREIKQA